MFPVTVSKCSPSNQQALFYFAGSGHSKYTLYLLEQITELEFESTPAMKDLFLRNWLINPSGEARSFVEGDLEKEHENRELEFFAQRGDIEFDSDFIRHVISPNLRRFLDLKKTWREGIGLAKRRGKHTEPSSRVEVRALLKVYQDEELHFYRPSRIYSDPGAQPLDAFADGVQDLYNGRLDRWKTASVQARKPESTTEPSQALDDDELDDVDDIDDEGDPTNLSYTAGGIVVEDDEVIVYYDGDGEDNGDWLTAGDADLEVIRFR